MSKRKVSVKELGKVDCQGWLYRKKEARFLLGNRWKKYWFVLKKSSLYWYTNQTAEKAEGYINLADFTVEKAKECRKKHAMKVIRPQVLSMLLAAESLTEMNVWMSKLSSATEEAQSSKLSYEDCYSVASDKDTDEAEPSSSCCLHSDQMSSPSSNSGTCPDVPSDDEALDEVSPPRSVSETEGHSDVDTQHQKRVSTYDEMEWMFVGLKEARVSFTGQPKPSTHSDFRTSFTRRCKNDRLNDKLHDVRILNSTLKAKEADLSAIDEVLADSSLTAPKYRQWRLGNVILLKEIIRSMGPADGSRELLAQALAELPLVETDV